ncbi:MAG: hypothetical protein A2138_19130 [Deltaproteobacteria bacterium RBG_16_71_12]|nr:MAG: hypothetical protein A2138_19130 [Deltaproteobacteria bacterium RBG_16_71_12]
MTDDARDLTLWRFDGAAASARADQVAHEEPLEIQVDGASLVVLMRTPGADEDLVRGFLLTEHIVASLDQIAGLQHCTTVPDPEAEDNVMLVRLRPDVRLDLERLRRHTIASSSCGVCGKATIDHVRQLTPPLDDGARLDPAVLYRLPARLYAAQAGFARTGGLHAAGLFSLDGELLLLREDVGRHNAVDKVVGALATGRLEPRACCLLVSGRVSWELVQKTAAARIPVLAGVSAPTSLAVRAATALGLTVIGFLRGESMNVYSCAERVRSGC